MQIRKGATDRSVEVFIIDSTDGTPENGVVHNTAGIDLWYRRDGGAKVSITEVALTTPALTDAHADGGFLLIGDGVYRLDLPDAAFASGANKVVWGGTVTGMIVIGGEAQLVDHEVQDDAAWRGTLSAIAAGTVTFPGGTGLDTDAQILIQLKGGTDAVGRSRYAVYSGAGEVWNVDPAWNSDGEAVPSGTLTAVVFSAPKSPVTAVPRVDVRLWKGVDAPDNTGDAFARLGAPAGASIAADLAIIDALINTLVARLTATRAGYIDNLSGGAVALTADLATLLVRLSDVRAGYIDKLNISGNVAASGEVTAIQNNTRVVRVVPDALQRPAAGSTVFTIELLAYDTAGNMEAPDAAPTLDVVNQAGTSRNANLDSTTMTLVSTGRYRATYTVASDAVAEQLIFAFAVVEGGATRAYVNTAQVVDTLASDFTSTDRSKLDALFGKLPSKSYLTGTNNADGDMQLNEATGTPADSAGVGTLLTRASEARLSELDAGTAGKLAHDVEQVLLTDRLSAARAATLGDLIDGGRLDLLIDATLAAAQAAPGTAAIAAAVRANLDGTALAAPTAPPAADAAPHAKLAWLFHLSRYALEQTATEQRVKSAAGATIAAAPVSDAAGVTTRGAFAAVP